MGQEMFFVVEPTVNPLVYKVNLSWLEPVDGSIALQVWNLLQKWMTTNDCVPYGTLSSGTTSIAAQVIVKRRFGDLKNSSP